MSAKSLLWKHDCQKLSHLVEQTEKAWPSGLSDEKAVRSLFRRLRIFYTTQTEYLLAHPTPQTHTPDDFVFHYLSQQVARDLEIIERVAHQRAWGSLEMQDSLRHTDHIARVTLMNAQNWFSEEIYPLTYFAHRFEARVLPYAPVVLLGLPYQNYVQAKDSFSDFRILLSFPQLIGWVVLQRARTAEPDRPYLRKTLRERLSRRTPSWCLGWAEWALASVYATKLSGPLAALYAQDAALQLTNINLTRSTTVQPAPLMAIQFHIRALYRLGLGDWAASLQERWNRKLAERQVKHVVVLPSPITELPIPCPIDHGLALADLAFSLLPEVTAPAWQAMYSETPAYPPHQLEDLYANVARHLAEWPATAPRTADWMQEESHAQLLTHNWLEAFITYNRRYWRPAPPPSPEERDWLAELEAGGWGEQSF